MSLWHFFIVPCKISSFIVLSATKRNIEAVFISHDSPTLYDRSINAFIMIFFADSKCPNHWSSRGKQYVCGEYQRWSGRLRMVCRS